MRSRFKCVAALTASAMMMVAVYSFTAIPSTAQGQTAPDPYGGHPDLNGIWQATTTANWDLLAHTTRPAVATALTSAASYPSPASSSSRYRATMNSE